MNDQLNAEELIELENPSMTDIPHQSSTEDAPEPLRKKLPECLTRGIPKPTYKP